MAEEPKRDIQARLRDLGLQFMGFLGPLSHLARNILLIAELLSNIANLLQLSLVYAATS